MQITVDSPRAPVAQDSLICRTTSPIFLHGLEHKWDIQWPQQRLAVGRLGARIQRDYERSVEHLLKLKELAAADNGYTPNQDFGPRSSECEKCENEPKDQADKTDQTDPNPAEPNASRNRLAQMDPSGHKPEPVSDNLRAIKIVGAQALSIHDQPTRRDRRRER